MQISIIIPTYNEAENIAETIAHLRSAPSDKVCEIIVADAGSEDNTIEVAKSAGATALISPVKGRAAQMNYGTRHAKGDIYYYVHADTKPPISYQNDIETAISKGYDCGSYITKFDSDKFILKINAFCTRLNYLFVRGGDQSIFVTKELYDKVGGYDERMRIMEDYNFLEKIWEHGKFKLYKKGTLVSARKYDNNSWLEVQLANLKAVRMYKQGASQEDIVNTYHRMLNYRKNAF